MKHLVEIPISIKFLVDDDAGVDTFYQGILQWLQKETARLEKLNNPEFYGTQRWPSNSNGACGLGAAVIFENARKEYNNIDSQFELIHNKK